MSTAIRDLIRQMSLANPLWDAPRIHRELLKLGVDVSQATVGKYLPRRPKVPSPTWRSFLHNTWPTSIDIATIVARHDRRNCFGVKDRRIFRPLCSHATEPRIFTSHPSQKSPMYWPGPKYFHYRPPPIPTPNTF